MVATVQTEKVTLPSRVDWMVEEQAFFPQLTPPGWGGDYSAPSQQRKGFKGALLPTMKFMSISTRLGNLKNDRSRKIAPYEM